MTATTEMFLGYYGLVLGYYGLVLKFFEMSPLFLAGCKPFKEESLKKTLNNCGLLRPLLA